MEISRFSNIECPRMLRVSDSAGPVEGSLSNVLRQCCLPLRTTGSASRMGDFGAQWLACASPCQLLHVQPRGYPHMTRGHNGAASPFMWGSFIPYSMPVYPGAFGPTPFDVRPGAPFDRGRESRPLGRDFRSNVGSSRRRRPDRRSSPSTPHSRRRRRREHEG